MFQHLLESNVVRQPRVGGSLVSTIAHAALVAAAVAITTQRTTASAAIPDPVARFITVVPPPTANVVHGNRSDAVSAASPRTSPPTLAVLPSMVDITLGVATPDLTRAVVDAADWSRRGPAGTAGTGIGSPGGIVGEEGTWLAENVDKPVLMRPGVPMPTYPAMLRSAGVAGGVLVEFVVDTLGGVEPGSLRVVQSDHELFAASVRDVLPRLRFMAAEARGRKVRQLVRLPFRFDLHPENHP